MGSYDPKKCTVNVGGRFITGFDEGTMVSSERDEDFFSEKTDAQGEPIVTETHNPFGTITITLSQTSPSLPYMNDLARSRKEFPVWVNYNGEPKEKSGGTRARAKKPAGKEYGDEAGSREFEIKVFDYTDQE
ncbi:phage structural protein [Bacillus badius]|uniref:DUF3277 domain-containing protein n=1 Tax=Bacillus badius TaxID=1455 RepID=A0ABR5ANX4_BACBA|nr:hypothetical protein [Bacillus badius]KIL72721.1 hypothetical protein SD77_3456 [Bacillus badius]MED4715432.1 DUF3277 domain-containing protein [Bacillus badius]